MFEKEAEEYVSKYQGYGWQPHRGSATFEAMLNCYKDGAEFGYNKANEYAKTIIQDLLNNSDEYARQRAMDFLKE